MTSIAADNFLRLLSAQEELVGIPKATSISWLQQYNLQSLLPADAFEILLLSDYASQAYSYRDDYSNASYAYGSSRVQTNVTLPDSIDSCRRLSLAHLQYMASVMDDQDSEALINLMKAAGVNHARMIVDLGGEQNLYSSAGALVEDYPDNEAMLAISIFSIIYDQPLEADLAAKAYDIFKQRFPELSFISALQAAGSEKKYHQLLDEALADEREFTPTYVLIAAIARYLSNEQYGEPALEHQLSEQHIQAINQKLLTWYPKLISGNMSTWMFRNISNSIRANGSAKPFIQFLDDEIVRHKSKSKKAASRWYYGQSGDGLVELISLPPAEYVSFPDYVAQSIVYRNDNENYYYGSSEVDLTPEQWLEKYSPVIETAKDPILRFLLKLNQVAWPGGIQRTTRKGLVRTAGKRVRSNTENRPARPRCVSDCSCHCDSTGRLVASNRAA